MSQAGKFDVTRSHADTMHNSRFIKFIYIYTCLIVDLVRTLCCGMQSCQTLTITIQLIDYAELIPWLSKTISRAKIGTSKWATPNREVGHIWPTDHSLVRPALEQQTTQQWNVITTPNLNFSSNTTAAICCDYMYINVCNCLYVVDIAVQNHTL